MRWIKRSTVALTTVLLCGLAAAQGPVPVYGPQSFERTSGESDLYVETFDAAAEGRFARAVRVVFFDPAGEVVAASERFVLPPRSSRPFALEDLIDVGAWQAGSIEIYYAAGARRASSVRPCTGACRPATRRSRR